jgi:hypothetical protein
MSSTNDKVMRFGADRYDGDQPIHEICVRASDYDRLERELAEANARCERMLDAEQKRLLLASEDEIRKEILADGRDPAEYLKALDAVMKVTGENALLKHDLERALANHAADLSHSAREARVARDEALMEAASICDAYNGWAQLAAVKIRALIGTQYVNGKGK